MMKCKRAISGIKFGLESSEKIHLCAFPSHCIRKKEKLFCSNPLHEELKDCPMAFGSGEPNAQGGITKTVPTNCQKKGCFGQAPMSEDKMKVCEFYKLQNEGR